MKQKHFSPELERAILKLPYNTQRNFRNALKPHLFTSEQFVPTKYEAKKVESNKDIMRNKLIDFQNNLKNKKLFLSQISKETKTFSKGYKGVAIDNNVSERIKRDKILYQDLLKRYKDQGYDTNKLFSDTNNNLFTKSIFLENNNNYENTLNITGKKEGLQLEQYLEKVDNILKGHHKTRIFSCALYRSFLQKTNTAMAQGKSDQTRQWARSMYLHENRTQQEMVKAYFDNDLVFAVGPAGTGKTYVAIALAVRALKNREIKRIILTRPAFSPYL